MTDGFFDGRIDWFFGRTDFWTDGFKKSSYGFLTDCQKKFLTDCFEHFFGHFLGNFSKFWQFLGQKELFPKLIGFFLGGRFFVRTVTSDCLADKFGGQLEIFTIRHHGWLCGSNRRPLPGAALQTALWSLSSFSSHSFTAPPRPNGYKIDYVIVIQNFLNPKGHHNPISGSKVTAILLKGWILSIGGASSGRVSACSLRSRLVEGLHSSISFISEDVSTLEVHDTLLSQLVHLNLDKQMK